MAEIPVWCTRLAVEFLEKYSERLGNDGCNDFDVPPYVPLTELKAALQDADPNNKDAVDGYRYNYSVVDAVAHLLKKAVK